jgi:hypothetical protein
VHRAAHARALLLAASRDSLFYCDAGSREPFSTSKPVPILTYKILKEYADQACEAACLRRNGAHTTCDRDFAEVLAILEASGDAMRFVDANGRISWKATPSLCRYLMDLEVDAQSDLEDV